MKTAKGAAFTELSFIKHGQWGIFDNMYGQVKTRFIYEWLCKYLRKREISTVCELGFMAGHSALLFLQTVKKARLVSFDLGDAPWSRPAAGTQPV